MAYQNSALAKAPGFIGGASNLLQISGAVMNLASATIAVFKPRIRPAGINGFLFDIPLNDEVKYTAQVTDHYVEGNFAIHDHVAIEPIRITTTGVLCELVYEETPIERLLSQYMDTLGLISVFGVQLGKAGIGGGVFAQPNFGLSASYPAAVRSILVEAHRAKAAFDKTKDAYENLMAWLATGTGAGTRQQNGYDELVAMFKGRTIGSVDTPWESFDDMIIESLVFNQDETTRDATTVTVTFKQIKMASANISIIAQAAKAAQTKAKKIPKGNTKEKTLLKAGKDQIVNGKPVVPQ